MKKTDFNQVFKTYEKPIYNYVLKMVKEQPTAEDLTQEIFIKVYRNLAGFRGKSTLSTWIYQIATNFCLDYFRSSSYKKWSRTELVDDDTTQNGQSEEIEKILSIENQLIKSEMSKCIHQFIDDLPEDYRAVTILHDLQGFKNREIAEIQNCSLDTVKIRLHRARKKLRTVLVSNCDFYRDDSHALCCDRKEHLTQ